ncbi:aldehyde dehydrogenase family protein [Colwellia sp. MB02u-18]|uniref:aldehyde dehydrogenase family protein n=1 Tax=unclassified Colwellia TaxID=196834 RepID=UPI0015F4FB60|nr:MULTISPECIES: aldehyde dehydrogenase family protein [unclassified Colwellia]MBA6224390.1 aldehyde dehydrogenase family protein [Colwellia sp. MB3u-45]MBA6268225.1 aldehyde dehydrogenase family protein [Colwellia sp. MB3u-43]MBA6321458.1 aldehyde dehydrogenase family protein [Colwellia sp. MB02u-19]MBA6323774.1 aldehyde dehydrogenase family protein [Colwellia sp. MB02u-18]MBA6331310.1 aldehyde dehydrogenase family protein [Colwellia sp. MB02u-12]
MTELDKSKSAETFDIVNPYDQTYLGSLPLVTWDDIDKDLATAQQLFKDRQQWLPAFERINILKKTAILISQRADELALLIASEGGKPLVDARVEVTRAIDGVELCAKEISALTGKQIPMDLTPAGAGRIAFTTKEPIGVVVAVSAFNHPLNLIVHQVAPAIAAGCPVLVKPARDTPLSCKAFVDILHQAGLPAQWCRFIMCETSISEKMITDPRVAFFSFIGSAKIGWMLRSKLAPGTRCALEHGGVAPVIIEESADIAAMIPSLLKGGFYHSGQVCVSVQRIFAPREQASAIAQMLADGAEKIIVGNAIDEATECGPLIRPKEVDRVEAWVDEAVSAGATLVTGGKRLGESTYAPTVLLAPPVDAKVSTMEIFGPVVCVYGYDDIDQAIVQANSLEYAFQASVFTKNLDIAMKAVQALDATAVMVNDHTAFRVDWMPFAGRKQSGYNTGGIAYTMHDMSQDKMAVIKL